MVSTLTDRGSEATLRALELGAVDYVSKPKIDIVNGIQQYADEIADKIRTAAASRPRQRVQASSAGSVRTLPALGNRIASRTWDASSALSHAVPCASAV